MATSRAVGRVRWVGLFVVLLLVVSAVPVLASEEGRAPSQSALEKEPRGPTEQELQMLPGPEDIREGIEASEREEETRERWLASPEAARQREESQLAFAALDPGAARELLSTVFAAELAKLNDDPARFLSDAQILASSEETSATVMDGGESMVLESSLPVKTEDEGGKLRKVDVSLRGTPEGYETANGLVDVRVPSAAEEPIEVGEDGVSIELVGAEGGTANQPFGEQNTLASEVLPDTDMLVSPIASGVEIFNLLRSERSPETVRFRVGMPAGAELRAVDGGAEVMRGDELLATIRKPAAVDAQGTDVPVALTIEGNTLALTVRHRGGDYALPILLDPILENNESWIYGQNWNALHESIWSFYKNVAGMHGSTYCIYYCWNIPGARGLFVSGQSGTYWAGQYAQWSYAAPNQHSYVSSATFHPFVRYDHGCNAATTQHKQPHDYVGLWNGSGWTMLHTNAANHPAGGPSVWGGGQVAVVGLSTGAANFSIPCWRDIYVQGAHVWLDDWGAPVINSVSGIPSGWFSDETQVTITPNVSDQGLGIHEVLVTQEGKNPIPDLVGCSGTRRSLCPTTRAKGIKGTGDSFGEGIRSAGVVVHDPTGKTDEHFFTTKVDNSRPEVALEGQLATATGEEVNYNEGENPVGEGEDKLSLPVYKLRIKAKDGSTAENKTKRSGVRDIRLLLDGEEKEDVPWEPIASCPQTSCQMDVTYTLKLSEIDTAGKHTLEVIAEDFVGKEKKRQIEFEYFPATGMKDEYVMHYFPLPNGEGDEESEEHPTRPELAVNVMNGNLVYREQDVDVEGPAIDLEVERYYNSQLPASEDTEWGDGWTLAQTPDLEPEEGATPVEAELVESSGAIEGGVELPAEAGEEAFDPELQATLKKKVGGGYELTDETGESATSVAFDQTGQTEARLTEGHAKVDYTYSEGELAEIAVKDPGSAGNPTEPPEGEGEEEEEEAGEAPTYSSSFGSNGAGDGQLKSPGDVAIDAAGDLWVVDKSNNRIQKFSPEGEFLSKFGSYGAGNGQFNRPTSIAIAANGELLVTDAGNGRIQRFSASGTYISSFGSKGTGNGQFSGAGPEGIAVGSGGEIYVSDTYAGRVQRFTSAGQYIESIGSKGSGEGQIGEPTGIDLDPSGNLWVADWQNNRVEVFDPEGAFAFHFGLAGAGEGEFNRPDALDIDEQGNVWVGDQNNDRVQRFDLAAQYVDEFGVPGSGEGQFNFAYPMGIAASEGRIWVADVSNHRIQEWTIPAQIADTYTDVIYAEELGAEGSEDGELDGPGDVAIDSAGDIWVADTGNDRIEKFDADGQFLAEFGVSGAGDGQLDGPTSLDIDASGDIWVLDAGNDRVQRFSPQGEYLDQFGESGSEEGQLLQPEALAIDPDGNIWVTDPSMGRVLEFDFEGQYLGKAGFLGQPMVGLDIDPEGNLWFGMFETCLMKVSPEAGLLSYNCKAGKPVAVEAGDGENVWVGDEDGKVHLVDSEAQPLLEFGEPGAEEGEFSLARPMGIAADGANGIWVTDTGNNRLQKWVAGHYVPDESEVLPEDDPSVEVQTPGGLVASVSGEEAGQHDYEHDGELLTAHDGPLGETEYEYENDRLSKVTLPNGTWASIAYDAAGRAKVVSVSIEGAEAKATHFTYKDESPRRTTVEPPDAPHVVYDIGDDGSVLKWWNTQVPPELDLSGSLYDNREEDGALWAGDHILDAEALSEEGIDSIEVIAGDATLVDEMTCEQDFEVEGKECKKVINEWVTNTGIHAPGRLQLEVIATGALSQGTETPEHETAERFWVDIPEPPPPPAPGTPIAPKFHEIADFREEYGLEVVFPVANEIELNERIFNLIKAWHEPGTPAGQVARASMDRWGVPLRPADVAELEYREWYLSFNGDRIEEWGGQHHPSTYAGYYMDHSSGGKLHIGFTESQATRLTELKNQAGVVAEQRLYPFPSEPENSVQTIQDVRGAIEGARETNSNLAVLITELGDSDTGNVVHIGAKDVVQVESMVSEIVGPSAPVEVTYRPDGIADVAGRNRSSGRMRAGDRIFMMQKGGACTAAFGAFQNKIKDEKRFKRRFVLTAGHCGGVIGEDVARTDSNDPVVSKDELSEFGTFNRNGLLHGPWSDGAAVRVLGTNVVPHDIYGSHGQPEPYGSATRARNGNILCYSGARLNGVSCGEVVGREMGMLQGSWIGIYKVKFKEGVHKGDSGGPVWNPHSGAAIGVVSGKFPGTDYSAVAPLLSPRRLNALYVPGILHDLNMAPINLITSD